MRKCVCTPKKGPIIITIEPCDSDTTSTSPTVTTEPTKTSSAESAPPTSPWTSSSVEHRNVSVTKAKRVRLSRHPKEKSNDFKTFNSSSSSPIPVSTSSYYESVYTSHIQTNIALSSGHSFKSAKGSITSNCGHPNANSPYEAPVHVWAASAASSSSKNYAGRSDHDKVCPAKEHCVKWKLDQAAKAADEEIWPKRNRKESYAGVSGGVQPRKMTAEKLNGMDIITHDVRDTGIQLEGNSDKTRLSAIAQGSNRIPNGLEFNHTNEIFARINETQNYSSNHTNERSTRSEETQNQSFAAQTQRPTEDITSRNISHSIEIPITVEDMQNKSFSHSIEIPTRVKEIRNQSFSHSIQIEETHQSFAAQTQPPTEEITTRNIAAVETVRPKTAEAEISCPVKDFCIREYKRRNAFTDCPSKQFCIKRKCLLTSLETETKSVETPKSPTAEATTDYRQPHRRKTSKRRTEASVGTEPLRSPSRSINNESEVELPSARSLSDSLVKHTVNPVQMSPAGGFTCTCRKEPGYRTASTQSLNFSGVRSVEISGVRSAETTGVRSGETTGVRSAETTGVRSAETTGTRSAETTGTMMEKNVSPSKDMTSKATGNRSAHNMRWDLSLFKQVANHLESAIKRDPSLSKKNIDACPVRDFCMKWRNEGAKGVKNASTQSLTLSDEVGFKRTVREVQTAMVGTSMESNAPVVLKEKPAGTQICPARDACLKWKSKRKSPRKKRNFGNMTTQIDTASHGIMADTLPSDSETVLPSRGINSCPNRDICSKWKNVEPSTRRSPIRNSTSAPSSEDIAKHLGMAPASTTVECPHRESCLKWKKYLSDRKEPTPRELTSRDEVVATEEPTKMDTEPEEEECPDKEKCQKFQQEMETQTRLDGTTSSVQVETTPMAVDASTFSQIEKETVTSVDRGEGGSRGFVRTVSREASPISFAGEERPLSSLSLPSMSLDTLKGSVEDKLGVSGTGRSSVSSFGVSSPKVVDSAVSPIPSEATVSRDRHSTASTASQGDIEGIIGQRIRSSSLTGSVASPTQTVSPSSSQRPASGGGISPSSSHRPTSGEGVSRGQSQQTTTDVSSGSRQKVPLSVLLTEGVASHVSLDREPSAAAASQNSSQPAASTSDSKPPSLRDKGVSPPPSASKSKGFSRFCKRKKEKGTSKSPLSSIPSVSDDDAPPASPRMVDTAGSPIRTPSAKSSVKSNTSEASRGGDTSPEFGSPKPTASDSEGEVPQDNKYSSKDSSKHSSRRGSHSSVEGISPQHREHSSQRGSNSSLPSPGIYTTTLKGAPCKKCDPCVKCAPKAEKVGAAEEKQERRDITFFAPSSSGEDQVETSARKRTITVLEKIRKKSGGKKIKRKDTGFIPRVTSDMIPSDSSPSLQKKRSSSSTDKETKDKRTRGVSPIKSIEIEAPKTKTKEEEDIYKYFFDKYLADKKPRYCPRRDDCIKKSLANKPKEDDDVSIDTMLPSNESEEIERKTIDFVPSYDRQTVKTLDKATPPKGIGGPSRVEDLRGRRTQSEDEEKKLTVIDNGSWSVPLKIEHGGLAPKSKKMVHRRVVTAEVPKENVAVPPRHHGEGCFMEVSVLQKHGKFCRSKMGIGNPDEVSGSYETIGRITFELCPRADCPGNIKRSAKGYHLNDPTKFGLDFVGEAKSKIELNRLLPRDPDVLLLDYSEEEECDCKKGQHYYGDGCKLTNPQSIGRTILDLHRRGVIKKETELSNREVQGPRDWEATAAKIQEREDVRRWRKQMNEDSSASGSYSSRSSDQSRRSQGGLSLASGGASHKDTASLSSRRATMLEQSDSKEKPSFESHASDASKKAVRW